MNSEQYAHVPDAEMLKYVSVSKLWSSIGLYHQQRVQFIPISGRNMSSMAEESIDSFVDKEYISSRPVATDTIVHSTTKHQKKVKNRCDGY